MESVVTTLLLGASAVSSLTLGGLVIARNAHRRAHQAFAVLALALGLWATGVAMVIHCHTEATARFWVIATFLVAGVIPMAFHVFVGFFPRQRYEGFRPLLLLLCVVTPLLMVGAFTPWYVTGIMVHADQPPTVAYGPVFYAFAVVVALTMAFSYPTLLRKLRTSSGIERRQVEHVLLGIVLFSTLATVTNIVAPIVGIDMRRGHT